MEREGSKIGNASYHLIMPRSSKSMCGIGTDSDTTDLGLQVISCHKKGFLTFHDIEDPLVVARYTGQVHRDNGFSARRDRCFYGLIIHLKAIFLAIDKHHFSTYVTNY